MPLYTYRCADCGKSDTAFRALAKRNRGPRCCNNRMERDIAADHGGRRHEMAQWPMVSTALGVHPSQIGEAMKLNESLGLHGSDCTFKANGDAVVTQKGRSVLGRHYGLQDLDAYKDL